MRLRKQSLSQSMWLEMVDLDIHIKWLYQHNKFAFWLNPQVNSSKCSENLFSKRFVLDENNL